MGILDRVVAGAGAAAMEDVVERIMPQLHRQLYWIYGGYVVLAIVANGLICVANADELAAGSRLARCVLQATSRSSGACGCRCKRSSM